MPIKLLKQLREKFARVWYGVDAASTQAENDALQEKLKGLTLQKSEDEELAERLIKGQEARGDLLAETAFRGRPQNPLAGED